MQRKIIDLKTKELILKFTEEEQLSNIKEKSFHISLPYSYKVNFKTKASPQFPYGTCGLMYCCTREGNPKECGHYEPEVTCNNWQAHLKVGIHMIKYVAKCEDDDLTTKTLDYFWMDYLSGC